MAPGTNRSARTESLVKIIFVIIFLSGIILFVLTTLVVGPGLDMFRIDAFELVLLSLATFRLGRLIAYDRVTEPIRAPFAKTVPDFSGAGMTVIARGQGVQKAYGQLISCPICAGTWIAAVLVMLLYFLPGPARVFLIMTAVVGGAELIHNATEALCWSGVHSRAQTGQIFKNGQRNPVEEKEQTRE